MAAWITKEQILAVVSDCKSFRELTIRLGRTPVGGNIVQMQTRCTKFGIDTSHFLGKSSARGKASSKRKTVDEVFVVGLPENGRAPIDQLRRALLECGVEYQCSVCGIVEWNGQPITLQIDHIDGQFWNNLKSNLRFICPNCHTQTPTFGSKKR